MTDEQLPPPPWPPPPPPPAPAPSGPASWPAPTVVGQDAPAPRPRANGLVLGGSIALVAIAIAALVGIALATGGDGPLVGPGYEPLTDDEVAATVEQATAIGAELDAWWAEELRQARRGDVYVPVGARLTDGDDGVRCDGDPVVLDDELVDNAWAALCREGPTVAFDPATFRGSEVALMVILAHEWGHVVQALDPQLDEIVVDPRAPYAETELQADCYAGAWAATTFTSSEVAAAVSELRAIGDPPGTADDDPDGHGSPDEREAAFRLGLDEGVEACFPEAFDAR